MKDIWLILIGGLLICGGAGLIFQTNIPASGLLLIVPGVVVGFAGLIENHKRHTSRRYR